ncbi:hypothetical protein QJQ45_030082 [Haematococcus lacustris]|nr:hypothetical protein QJQ45_030082 [Haematococcus lacustris]
MGAVPIGRRILFELDELYYPIGNTKAVSWLNPHPYAIDTSGHCRVLSLGCGDPRNLLLTLGSLNPPGPTPTATLDTAAKASSCSYLELHANDHNPSIIARNMVLLALATEVDPASPTDMQLLFDVWYNLLWDKSSQVEARFKTTIQHILDGRYPWMQVPRPSDMRKVHEVLRWWLEEAGQSTPAHVLEVRQAAGGRAAGAGPGQRQRLQRTQKFATLSNATLASFDLDASDEALAKPLLYGPWPVVVLQTLPFNAQSEMLESIMAKRDGSSVREVLKADFLAWARLGSLRGHQEQQWSKSAAKTAVVNCTVGGRLTHRMLPPFETHVTRWTAHYDQQFTHAWAPLELHELQAVARADQLASALQAAAMAARASPAVKEPPLPGPWGTFSPFPAPPVGRTGARPEYRPALLNQTCKAGMLARACMVRMAAAAVAMQRNARLGKPGEVVPMQLPPESHSRPGGSAGGSGVPAQLCFWLGDCLQLCQGPDLEQHWAHRPAAQPTVEGAPQQAHQEQQASQPPLMFHVIDTSNVADHAGLFNLLLAAQPRLVPHPLARLITCSMTWMTSSKSMREYLQSCLSCPPSMYPTLLGLRLVSDITVGRPQPLDMAAQLRAICHNPWLLVWNKPVAAVGTAALTLALKQGQQQLMAAGQPLCKDPSPGPGPGPGLAEGEDLHPPAAIISSLAAQPGVHAAADGDMNLPQGPSLLRFTKVVPVVMEALTMVFERGTPKLRALLLPVAATSAVSAASVPSQGVLDQPIPFPLNWDERIMAWAALTRSPAPVPPAGVHILDNLSLDEVLGSNRRQWTLSLLLPADHGLDLRRTAALVIDLAQGETVLQPTRLSSFKMEQVTHSPDLVTLLLQSAAAGWAAGPDWAVAGCGGHPAAASSKVAQCCAQCGTLGEGLLRCGRCREVTYCSPACQKKHWKAHKASCHAPADAASHFASTASKPAGATSQQAVPMASKPYGQAAANPYSWAVAEAVETSSSYSLILQLTSSGTAGRADCEPGGLSAEVVRHWDWEPGSSSTGKPKDSRGTAPELLSLRLGVTTSHFIALRLERPAGVRPLLLQLPWPISSGADEPHGMPLGCYSGGQGLESVQLRHKSGQVWLKLRKAECCCWPQEWERWPADAPPTLLAAPPQPRPAATPLPPLQPAPDCLDITRLRPLDLSSGTELLAHHMGAMYTRQQLVLQARDNFDNADAETELRESIRSLFIRATEGVRLLSVKNIAGHPPPEGYSAELFVLLHLPIQEGPDGGPILPITVIDTRLTVTLAKTCQVAAGAGLVCHAACSQRSTNDFLQYMLPHMPKVKPFIYLQCTHRDELMLLRRMIFRNALRCKPTSSQKHCLPQLFNDPSRSPWFASYLSPRYAEHLGGEEGFELMTGLKL